MPESIACLLLLPWYTTITGYQISSNNNNQEKSTIGYGQTSKSLLEQVGQQEWKSPQTDRDGVTRYVI